MRTRNDGQSHVPEEAVDIQDSVLAVEVVAAKIVDLDGQFQQRPEDWGRK